MPNTPDRKVYDEEPVEYCAKCYSLKIKYEELTDTAFCADCGCTEIRMAPIEKWEKLFEGRYGKKFVEKSNDPKKSIFFTMSHKALKQALYNSKDLKGIIKKLYPRFPIKYGKEDLVLMLFDRLYKDNRLDDLKMALYNAQKKNLI